MFTRIRLQKFHTIYDSNMFLRNVGKQQEGYTASQPWRPRSTLLSVKYAVTLAKSDFPPLNVEFIAAYTTWAPLHTSEHFHEMFKLWDIKISDPYNQHSKHKCILSRELGASLCVETATDRGFETNITRRMLQGTSQDEKTLVVGSEEICEKNSLVGGKWGEGGGSFRAGYHRQE